MNYMAMTLDDRNPSIVYQGQWLQGGTASEFDGTTTWINHTGPTASLTFSGIQIAVFGTIPPNGAGPAPGSRYTIDGGPKTAFQSTQQADTQFQQLFFQSDILDASVKHTLEIENSVDHTPFILDFFNITTAGELSVSPTSDPPSAPSTPPVSNEKATAPVTKVTSTPSSAVLSPSSSTFSFSVTSLLAESTTSTTLRVSTAGFPTQLTGSHSSTRNVRASEIIGGMLGGAFVITLGAIALILRRRKQRRGRQQIDEFRLDLPVYSSKVPPPLPTPTRKRESGGDGRRGSLATSATIIDLNTIMGRSSSRRSRDSPSTPPPEYQEI